MTTFIRLLEAAVDDKPETLRHAVEHVHNGATSGIVFERDPAVFSSIPRAPFAYWASATILHAFSSQTKFERDGRTAKQGLATGMDARFLRVFWEVQSADGVNRDGWVPLVKGGAPKTYYSDFASVVKWHSDGVEVKAFASNYRESRGWGDQWSAMINASERYFEPGFTWPLRASRFAPAAMPEGCAFSTRGCAGLASPDELVWLIPILASSCFDVLFKMLLGRFGHPEFTSGALQEMPVPDPAPEVARQLADYFRDAWSSLRSLDSACETSHAFLLPPILNARLTTFSPSAVARKLGEIQKSVDDAAFALYGIGPADRSTIEAATATSSYDDDTEDADREEADDDNDEEVNVGAGDDALGSWLVGVAFGRFDPRLASGERAIPPEPEPFDPLPSRAPGMYPEGEEPAEGPDILLDDEGHADDLAARARAVAERVDVDVPENLRGWLAKEFFPLHIKMYSKSRRKAPIYWQLATPSASYAVWLYMHAVSKDTLFRVQNDYAAPKLAHEERRLESLTRELREKATAAQRKQLVAQESVVDELRAFLEEVKRVAPLWSPNLDDGVVINFAPLWRLVPQNRPWQKELKSTWDALCEGKYDWAHLAMHLWPERTIPKCAKDRSLAIAHGLKDVFWVAGADGKWTARKTPTRSIDELVRERTSSAVKAALKSLLEAPVSQGGGGRGRDGRGRTAATADEGSR
jgi:hypothetical protein